MGSEAGQASSGQVGGRRSVRWWLRSVIEGWALAGGWVLIGLVAINTYSLIAGEMFDAPLAGAFEMVQLGVAVAAFAFLPYCQLTDSNVSADIFTSGAGPRAIAGFRLLAAVIAALIAVILLWRMWFGLIDYREYEEVTAIMSIPVWYAFVPILVSLVLLCVACGLSLVEAICGKLGGMATAPGAGRGAGLE